jgi:hypothetical protein
MWKDEEEEVKLRKDGFSKTGYERDIAPLIK